MKLKTIALCVAVVAAVGGSLQSTKASARLGRLAAYKLNGTCIYNNFAARTNEPTCGNALTGPVCTVSPFGTTGPTLTAYEPSDITCNGLPMRQP